MSVAGHELAALGPIRLAAPVKMDHTGSRGQTVMSSARERLRAANLTFTAIDVETANADPSSICQIGIVSFQHGEILDKLSVLVNPESPFSSSNVKIHGIREDTVSKSDTLPDIHGLLRSRLDGRTLVSHTGFDRLALERAMEKYQLPPVRAVWLDSAQIARDSWPEKYKRRRCGLVRVASDLNITFRHHDALEDAIAAGMIVVCACRHTDRDLDDWIETFRANYRHHPIGVHSRTGPEL